MACLYAIYEHVMSQFGLEDKVCHCLIGDDLLMLKFVCANMLI